MSKNSSDERCGRIVSVPVLRVAGVIAYSGVFWKIIGCVACVESRRSLSASVSSPRDSASNRSDRHSG